MDKNNLNWLFSQYLLGEITDDEKRQLDEWINLSPENKAFFDEICSSDTIASSYSTYKRIDTNRAFQNFRKRTGQKSKNKIFAPWLKYAAAVLLLISLSLPFIFHFRSDLSKQTASIKPGSSQAVLVTDDGSELALNSDSVTQIKSGNKLLATNSAGNIHYNNIEGKNITEKYNTLIIPRGGEYRVTLSDGTKIHLNSATELRYPVAFNSKSREVYLKGEAYFDIAKDSKRPFFVNAEDIKIKQYGTAFNVNNRDGQFVEITLVHGSVSILTHNAHDEVLLAPYQLAKYNKAEKTVDVKTVDILPYVAWHDGKFIFNDKPLNEIMETLSLWYDINAEFKNADIETLRFTGNVSREAPIQDILKAIEFTTEAEISIKNKTVYINN